MCLLLPDFFVVGATASMRGEVSCPTMGVFECSDCNARDVGRSVFPLGDCSGVRLSGVVVSVVIRVGFKVAREGWR